MLHDQSGRFELPKLHRTSDQGRNRSRSSGRRFILLLYFRHGGGPEVQIQDEIRAVKF